MQTSRRESASHPATSSQQKSPAEIKHPAENLLPSGDEQKTCSRKKWLAAYNYGVVEVESK